MCNRRPQRKCCLGGSPKGDRILGDLERDARVCDVRVCEAALSPRLLAFGRKSGRFRNDLTWGPRWDNSTMT